MMFSIKKTGNEFQKVHPELKNLLEMFEFYLTERSLKKPIDSLAEAVRDLRIIIQRLLNFYLSLSQNDERQFTALLAKELAKHCKTIPMEKGNDEEYCSYCIEQMLVPFEWAAEIKLAYSDSPEMQKMLSADIPILRPFDYGLQGKMKVLHPKLSKSKKK